jgi:hypothetical protein
MKDQMKKIFDSEVLASSSSHTGVRRLKPSPFDEELRSILGRIHLTYAGSLSAFFEQLERESEQPQKPATPPIHGRKLAA